MVLSLLCSEAWRAEGEGVAWAMDASQKMDPDTQKANQSDVDGFIIYLLMYRNVL